jgi:hypothetical protein
MTSCPAANPYRKKNIHDDDTGYETIRGVQNEPKVSLVTGKEPPSRKIIKPAQRRWALVGQQSARLL